MPSHICPVTPAFSAPHSEKWLAHRAPRGSLANAPRGQPPFLSGLRMRENEPGGRRRASRSDATARLMGEAAPEAVVVPLHG